MALLPQIVAFLYVLGAAVSSAAQTPGTSASVWSVVPGAAVAVSASLPAGPGPPTSQLLDLTMGADLAKVAPAKQPLGAPAPRLQLLCRVPQPPSEPSVQIDIRFGDHVEASARPAADGQWQLVALGSNAPWPTAAWQLEVHAKTGTRVELLLPCDPSAAWRAGTALRDLATYYTAAKNPTEARVALESLAALAAGTGEGAVAAADAAAAAAAAGDARAATALYLRSLTEVGTDPAAWSTFPGGAGYGQNRAALDLGSRVRDQLGGLAKASDETLLDPAYQAVAVDYPLRPATKAAALAIARALTKAHRAREAVPWLLLVMDESGDHDPVKATLRLPENQHFLDEISKPTDPALLAECVSLLAQAEGAPLGAQTVSEVVAAWTGAEQAGLERNASVCRARFSRVAKRCEGSPVAACARVALSEWLQYLGYFIEAEDALAEAGRVDDAALRQWRDFQRGRVLVSEGLYARAANQFAAAEAGPPGLLSAYAGLYRGECLEFQGQWPEAVAAYEAIAKTAGNPDLRRKAAFWKYRVTTLAAQYHPAFGSAAAYWGEDRQTQGQWDGYGDDVFLLCGAVAPADLMGGLEAPMRYRVYTSDPARHRYFWNWHSVAAHPSVLHNPAFADSLAANWDDGGENYAIGTGPDLLTDLQVPEGLHRLSLYVVNDFNYYEPRRTYTIYLLDEERRALAACAVRDFEGGVYYHFAVQGPRRVTVRIYRNLSMNVLLQGVFLDRLDGRTGTMAAPQGAYGPLGALLAGAVKPPQVGAHVGFCAASDRRREVAGLLASPASDLVGDWQAFRILNAYGVGRLTEGEYLGNVYHAVARTMSVQDACRFWADTAAAQQAAGLRAGTARYTREALDLAERAARSRDERLAPIEAALASVHAPYGYYFAGSNMDPHQPLVRATDEFYSMQLARDYVRQALDGQTLMRAAADILPLARRYSSPRDRALPLVLFDAVGVDRLGSSDLVLYARCTGDKAAGAKALSEALLTMGAAGDPHGSLSSELVLALGEAGDAAGSGIQLQRLLDRPDVSDETKASVAYALACTLELGGRGDAAKPWFGVVVQRFAGTQYAVLARQRLDRLSPRQGEGGKP